MKGFVNNIYKVMMTAMLSIVAINGATAQEYVNTPVEISKEKVKIDGKICKNLLLTTTTGSVYYLLMISGEKKFVTKEVSKKLGTSRLSFASAEKMRELLNTEPGSLSVTGLIFDKTKTVKLAVDRCVLDEEYVCCHPSDNSATLKIKTKDLTEKLLPSFGADPVIIDV